MKDLGPAHHILGMKITKDRTSKWLWLTQSDYVWRILDQLNLATAKPATTPLPANLRLSLKDSPTSGLEGDHMKFVPYAPTVGSLMYAMVATRQDIAHVVGIISSFMHNPGRAHWNVVKHIFRYLVGTKDYGIAFAPDEP